MSQPSNNSKTPAQTPSPTPSPTPAQASSQTPSATTPPTEFSRSRMYGLLVGRSVMGRGARVATALAAVALAATVTAALGNLQVALKGKLERQLAAFGPNLLITRSAALDLSDLRVAAGHERVLLAPYRHEEMQIRVPGRGLAPVGATAVDPGPQRQMNGWWRVQGAWMTRPGEAMMGVDLADRLGARPGSVYRLQSGAVLQVTGLVTAGSEDDSALFVPLASNTVDGAAARAPGDAARVAAIADRLRHALPGASVQVLQRVAQADTLVLARLGEVFGLLGLVIVTASGLCVSTTFSTMVSQRSREIGLQKALGATDSEVVALFWGEALLLGSAGTLVGYILGVGFADWIGQSVFHSPVGPQLVVFPGVILVAIGMTLAAAAPSVRRIARIEPAVTLKGSTREFSR